MFKKIIKTGLISSLFIFSFIALAQDDNVADNNIPVAASMQVTLEKINTNLLDFTKRFSDFNSLILEDDKNYVGRGPALDPQELDKIKEPAKSMILAHQFPENRFNTILQAGNYNGVPMINASAQSLTMNALQTIFTTLNACPPGLSTCNLRDGTIAAIAQLHISLPYDTTTDRKGFITPESYTRALSQDPTDINVSDNKSIDLNTLLGPLAYAPPPPPQSGGGNTSAQPSTDTQMALNFINLITQQSLPIQLKDALSGDPSLDNLYLARLRGYASHQSVDLSNYYQMLARRIIMGKSGKSQWEMEQEVATRRLNNNWHDEMEKAAPAVVQREILYLLAEINYQLYQSRVEQERLLATVTAEHALMLQTAVKPGFAQRQTPTSGPAMLPLAPGNTPTNP